MCACIQAWRLVKEDSASLVLARMYRGFKSRRELGRLMWKIQARRQKRNVGRYGNFALTLQCWWRAVLALRLYIAQLRHHVEIIPDLVERRLYFFISVKVYMLHNFILSHDNIRYYCNHNTGECSWTPPRYAECLHYPQDYVLAHKNNLIYFIKWSISREGVHLRTWKKPPGYSRCTQCLQNLALLTYTAASGVFCFRCFRSTFDAHDFTHGVKKQQRVGPIMCSMCTQERVASWRCTERPGESGLAGLTVCVHCCDRMGADCAWSRI